MTAAVAPTVLAPAAVPADATRAWSRRDTLGAVVLGVGLGLTTATKLRLPGVPIGPGEIVLVGWLGGTVVAILREGRLAIDRTFRFELAIWTALLLALLGGLLMAVGAGHARVEFVRDVFAYLLSGLLLLATLARPHAERRLVVATRVLCATVVAGTAALMVLGLAGSAATRALLFYSATRFSGLAENPNQLALALVPMPFVLAALWPDFGRRGRVGLALAMALTIPLGLAVDSDALTLAWLVGAGGLGLTSLVRWTLRGWRSRRPTARLGVIALLLALLAVLVVATPPVVREARRFAALTAAKGNQGETRGNLWIHGLEAIARSPVVGWGPGAHSGHTQPFQRLEAHNSFIDVGMSTGLVGVAAFVLHLGRLGWVAIRRRDVVAAYGVVALILFSCFHYVLRQPVFWMASLGLSVLARPAGTRQLSVGRTRP